MKHFLSIILLSLFVGVALAQKPVKHFRVGNNFVQVDSAYANRPLKTKYTWEIKGIKYPIYMSSKGKVYIIKKSKSTGKEYKYYLPEEVATTIKNQK